VIRPRAAGRRARAGAALLLLVVAALAPGPAGAACPGCLTAGAARVALAPPAGTPLAGYGGFKRRLLVPDLLDRHPHAFWLKPSTAARDPIAARALILEAAGRRVAWLALDLVAVDRGLVAEIERRAVARGVRAATLIVSASHTHSGPGAFVDSTLFGFLTLDRYDARVRDALAEAAADALARAEASRRPARLGAGTAEASALVRSRLGRALDQEMVVLRVVDADERPLALLWNFAIHGTVLGAANVALSGDVMGAASRALEDALGVPALFVNGAVGDVSPRRHGAAALDPVGRALAAAARRAWDRARPVAADRLLVAGARVHLGAPAVPVRNCLAGWVPRGVALPLGDALPREASLLAAAVGDVAWVTVPGELQAALGLRIKAAGAALGFRTVVAGLSNDYLGYFVTEEDHDRPGYVTCASLYGPVAGRCLVDGASALLAGLRPGAPPAPASACEMTPVPAAPEARGR
jgi:neutral ceramidase